MKMFMVTHNINGLFDGDDVVLTQWASELAELALPMDPDFIAVHMQEVGGSNWKSEGVNRSKMIVSALVKLFREHWCSGFLCNPDTSNEFTALGAVFLVRRSILGEVRMWDFGEQNGTMAGGGRPSGWKSLDDDQVVGAETLGPSLGDTAKVKCRHGKFPQHFFAESPGWSRKGFLHTRWSLAGCEVDMLNVHLFHDASNLTAIERPRADESGSLYAARRLGALRHALHGTCAVAAHREADTIAALADAAGHTVVTTDTVPMATPDVAPAATAHGAMSRQREQQQEQRAEDRIAHGRRALFVFGDFNFRLDLPAVVEMLAGPAGLAAVSGGQTVTLPVTLPSALGTNLALGEKMFSLSVPGTLEHLLEGGTASTLRTFDREPCTLFADRALPLFELPVRFAPTYMRDTDESAAAGSPRYGTKRCPAWTDRVLMDRGAWGLVQAATAAPQYTSCVQPPGSMHCDHDMVYLAFELGASS